MSNGLQELRAEYERHFTSGELVVGRKKEASLVKTILQKIELEDLLLEARNFTLDQNCVIKATSYQRSHSSVVDLAPSLRRTQDFAWSSLLFFQFDEADFTFTVCIFCHEQSSKAEEH